MTIKAAKRFVADTHRHHPTVVGALWAVGVMVSGELRGVALVGRPVARMLDDGLTAEVTRLTTDGAENACSMLYGACRRAAKALGYRRLVTYTLAEEPGTSLRAAGWRQATITDGGEWSRPSRSRKPAAQPQPKVRWEAGL
jgi:hypothetical protein